MSSQKAYRDPQGPVTDYASSMVYWMRHRRPDYRGGALADMERPSLSYMANVRELIVSAAYTKTNDFF